MGSGTKATCFTTCFTPATAATMQKGQQHTSRHHSPIRRSSLKDRLYHHRASRGQTMLFLWHVWSRVCYHPSLRSEDAREPHAVLALTCSCSHMLFNISRKAVWFLNTHRHQTFLKSIPFTLSASQLPYIQLPFQQPGRRSYKNLYLNVI